MVTKPATEKEAGARIYKCTVCQKELRTEVIPAIGESNSGGNPSGGGTQELPEEQQRQMDKLIKELGVSAKTAQGLLEFMAQYDVEMDTLLLTEKDITSHTSEKDIKSASFAKIQARAAKASKNSISLKWNKVKGADGYEIYASKCGAKNKYKLVKTVAKGSATSFTYKKLKKGTAYKIIVRAYKIMDGKKYSVSASKIVHAATAGGKYGNPTALKVKKGALTVKRGKKASIKVTLKKSAKKKFLNHRKLCYESTDKSIATVNASGKVTGRKKGTCYVYVYAENGMYKKIKIKVS